MAGGWRLYTHLAYHSYVEEYVLSWDTRRLSQAALEALAVVAYGDWGARPMTDFDVLVRRGFAPLAGRRIGLLTHRAARARDGRTSAEVLAGAEERRENYGLLVDALLEQPAAAIASGTRTGST